MWDLGLDILSGQSPLIVRDARISPERVVGCDVIRKDHLGRNVVVLPKGAGVPDDIPLTEREQSLVRPAPKTRRVCARAGMGSSTSMRRSRERPA